MCRVYCLEGLQMWPRAGSPSILLCHGLMPGWCMSPVSVFKKVLRARNTSMMLACAGLCGLLAVSTMR